MMVSDTPAEPPISESLFTQAQYYDAYANLLYRNMVFNMTFLVTLRFRVATKIVCVT